MFNKKIVSGLLSHPSIKDKITNIEYKHDGYYLNVSFYHIKANKKIYTSVKFDKTEGWFRMCYDTVFKLTNVDILTKLLDGDIKLIKLYYKAMRLSNKAKYYDNIVVDLDKLKIDYRHKQNCVYYQE